MSCDGGRGWRRNRAGVSEQIKWDDSGYMVLPFAHLFPFFCFFLARGGESTRFPVNTVCTVLLYMGCYCTVKKMDDLGAVQGKKNTPRSLGEKNINGVPATYLLYGVRGRVRYPGRNE